MQTATGRQFWPMDPRPNEVFIEDIAHALSMICRFGGHCLRFYSVAEHSVLLARSASPEFKRWALLHDAAEGYLVDIVRPVKQMLPEYAAMEARVMRAIELRFDLHLGMPAQVKALDRRILMDERAQNMAPTADKWEIDVDPLGVQLQFWSPERAKREFIQMFLALRWRP